MVPRLGQRLHGRADPIAATRSSHSPRSSRVTTRCAWACVHEWEYKRCLPLCVILLIGFSPTLHPPSTRAHSHSRSSHAHSQEYAGAVADLGAFDSRLRVCLKARPKLANTGVQSTPPHAKQCSHVN